MLGRRPKSLFCAETPSKIPPSVTHSLISIPTNLPYLPGKTASMLNKHHNKVVYGEVDVDL
jgi:hypothetical protein